MSGNYVRKFNSDYPMIGSQYAHVVIWRGHHGVSLDPDTYIIHHKNHDKSDPSVCSDDSGHCPTWDCGNLAPMTRADHIREHKPGRMSGERIPNKKGRKQYQCEACGDSKSRRGKLCRACYFLSLVG